MGLGPCCVQMSNRSQEASAGAHPEPPGLREPPPVSCVFIPAVQGWGPWAFSAGLRDSLITEPVLPHNPHSLFPSSAPSPLTPLLLFQERWQKLSGS